MACLSLGLGACGDTPPPPAAPGLDAATAQQLFERLDRLVGALEAMPRQTGALAVPVEAVAERTPVVDTTSELKARIDALEREVAMLGARSGSSFAAARTAPVLPMQLHAVKQVSDQLRSKDGALKQEARRSLFRLNQQQVLERFGMPSWTEVTKESSVRWVYESEEMSFSVTFVDGLTTVIYPD